MIFTTSLPEIRWIPTMVFIDGGYLRKWISEECRIPIENYNFGKFVGTISNFAGSAFRQAEVKRTYFYDGLADPKDAEYENQKKIQDWISLTFPNFEIRRGQLVRDSDGKFRQKGVDVLMAIDLIDKASLNLYDIAIVVAGDLDHLEAIKVVKNRGKQVFGVYYDQHIAVDLLSSFDRSHKLTKNSEGQLTIKQSNPDKNPK